MSMPFTPMDAKALIVQPEDNLCAALIKVIKSFCLAYRYFRYRYDDNGNISTAFCNEIKVCAAPAAATTTTTT